MSGAGASNQRAYLRRLGKLDEALLDRFPENPELQQKARADLARLDLVGRPAPRVVAEDLYGAIFRLSDLKGQVVLVDFWATWCAPCLADLPALQAAYSKYHARGFEVVSISLDETADPLVDFVKARKLPWRQVHNATCGGDAVAALGVTNIPATFLGAPDGTIARIDLRGPALEKALGTLIR